jgi:hypothetical protein
MSSLSYGVSETKCILLQRITFCCVCVCVCVCGTERRIGGPHLRSLAPMSQQSWLWTSCFTFSIEPAMFPYVSPFPSNRHFSHAFGDVSLCQLLILFLCILGDVWCVVVSVTYIVLVFFGTTKWFRVLWKFLRSTRIVCGRCSRCWGFRTDVGCYGKMVHQVGCYLSYNSCTLLRWPIGPVNWRYSNMLQLLLPHNTDHLHVRVLGYFF